MKSHRILLTTAQLWETPVGYVEKTDMSTIWKLNDEYGDNGPHQHLLMSQGKTYANSKYPNLDSFGKCTVTRYDLERRELSQNKFENEWNYAHFNQDGEEVVYEEHSIRKEEGLEVGFVLVLFFGFVIASVLVIKNRNKIWKNE